MIYMRHTHDFHFCHIRRSYGGVMSEYGQLARVGVYVYFSQHIRGRLDGWVPVDAGSVVGADFAARSSGRTRMVAASVSAGGQI